MPPQSILEYLASSRTVPLEDAVTNGLAYLLNRNRDVYEAFRGYISITSILLPDSLLFGTRVKGTFANTYLDMVGLDDEKKPVLIIESKLGASLMPHQPVDYIPELPLTKPALLLFIAPEARLPYLWQKLVERCDKRGTPREAPLPLRVLAIDAGSSTRVLALTSWESMLNALLIRPIRDNTALEEIRQLQNLCAGIIPPSR